MSMYKKGWRCTCDTDKENCMVHAPDPTGAYANPEPAKAAQTEGPVTAEMVSAALRDTSQLNFGVERWFLIRDHINAALAHAGQPRQFSLGQVLGYIGQRFKDREPHTGAWDVQLIEVTETIQKLLAEEKSHAGQPAPKLETPWWLATCVCGAAAELVSWDNATSSGTVRCLREGGCTIKRQSKNPAAGQPAPSLLWPIVDHLRAEYPSYGAGETLSLPATKDVVEAVLKALAALGHSPNTVKSSTPTKCVICGGELEKCEAAGRCVGPSTPSAEGAHDFNTEVAHRAWNAGYVAGKGAADTGEVKRLREALGRVLEAAKWAVYALEHGSSIEVHWLQSIAHVSHARAKESIAIGEAALSSAATPATPTSVAEGERLRALEEAEDHITARFAAREPHSGAWATQLSIVRVAIRALTAPATPKAPSEGEK